MHLISASRKTDIPVFYMEWFMRRIAEGKAYVYNAYRNEAKAVSLDPEQVGAIVFWSKNYRPALPNFSDSTNLSEAADQGFVRLL